MLKIEKSARSTQLIITLRKKEIFFNSLLLKAFFIALLIHLGIGIFFRIQPFLIKAEFTHPPIQVQMEHPVLSRLTLIEEADEQMPSLPAPPLLLFIPEFDFKIESQLTSPEIEYEVLNHPFEALEKKIIAYKVPPLNTSLTSKPIQFFISGELAQREVIKYDSRIDESFPYKVQNREPAYITFKVYVDADGSVFWYDILRTTGNAQQNQLAEQFLLSLEFAYSKLNINSTGIIDFVIHSSE
jgi:hypothetical protein